MSRLTWTLARLWRWLTQPRCPYCRGDIHDRPMGDLP